jgi:hypothetical protein
LNLKLLKREKKRLGFIFFNNSQLYSPLGPRRPHQPLSSDALYPTPILDKHGIKH